MAAAVAGVSCVRLDLTAAEIAVLAALCSVELPPGFATGEIDESARADAASTLVGRSLAVVDADSLYGCRPVAPIAMNLALLTASLVTVRFEVAVGNRGLRAFYAVAGPLSASLFTRAAGAVELSMFLSEELGRELVRAVPGPDETLTAASKVRSALAGAEVETLMGRLPLAALSEYPISEGVVGRSAASRAAGGVGVSAAEVALAQRITALTTGTLWCQVSGRGGDPTSPRLSVGHVVWLATAVGWIGLRPDPDDSDRRMVVVQPVEVGDIGGWLAPYIAALLEADDEST
jgi:hypothetical protein